MNTLTKSTFKQFINTNFSNTSIKNSQNENWNIHPQLYDAVYNGMPTNDLSLEDKAIYIYLKLCKIFTYNENFFYRNNLKNGVYDATFSSTHLENITSKSKITCFDFARILYKFIDGLDKNITAVLLSENPNSKHLFTGFYTDKVSVILEGTKGKTAGTNELTKVKAGMQLEGIQVISDKYNLIDKAINTIYPQILGKSPISIDEYMENFKKEAIDNNTNTIEQRLLFFIQKMKENNISGNEAIQMLGAIHRYNFFDEPLERAYIGKKTCKYGQTSFKRFALIRKNLTKSTSSIENNTIYLLDTDFLRLSNYTKEELLNILHSKKFIYENTEHKMVDIEI